MSVASSSSCQSAQRREREYSPSKRPGQPAVPDDLDVAQRREREYSPSKASRRRRRRLRCRDAQRREREYSPSKRCGWRSGTALASPRSTKGAGIFPLQGARRLTLLANGIATLNEGSGNIPPPSRQAVCRRRQPGHRSTKGAGIFPLQVRVGVGAGLVERGRSTKGAGIFPLQGVWSDCCASRRRHNAQRREREYSPSKEAHSPGQRRRRPPRSTKGAGIFPLQGQPVALARSDALRRSTKGAGIFPLQAACIPLRHLRQRVAQRREREYSPSKGQAPARLPTAGPLNEGSGNIPPPSRWGCAVGWLMSCTAQRREREYSPSKHTVTLRC